MLDDFLYVWWQALQTVGSPQKRRAALTALERLVWCAGYGTLDVTPYERSPKLLPTLLQLLESDSQVRSCQLGTKRCC